MSASVEQGIRNFNRWTRRQKREQVDYAGLFEQALRQGNRRLHKSYLKSLEKA